MKSIVLAVFVVGLGLMTGCAGMNCPMQKEGQIHADVGRYQIAGDGQGHFMKIDTRTGKTWSTGGAKWADCYQVPEK